MTLAALDLSTLDPGIRETVRRLRAAGFDTLDSGDGVTKFAAGADLGESLEFPHVVIRCEAADLVRDARRLFAFITESGLCVEPVGHPAGWVPVGLSAIWIQADYDPATDIATIMLAGVGDGAWGAG